MGIVTATLAIGDKPTADQLAQVKRAATLPITYDDDGPRLTAEQLAEFRPVNQSRRREVSADLVAR